MTDSKSARTRVSIYIALMRKEPGGRDEELPKRGGGKVWIKCARTRGICRERRRKVFRARGKYLRTWDLLFLFFLLSYRAAVSFMVFARTRDWKLYMKFPCAWD